MYRIIEMTLLLAVILPMTLRWFGTRYHIAVHLHNVVNVLYFVDIVRRHSHPHSWIVNAPCFVAWLVDFVIGFYWRRERVGTLSRPLLSDNYMLLYWTKNPPSNCQPQLNTVGLHYFLRLADSSLLERAHVFNAFENRLNIPLTSDDDLNDIEVNRQWSVCLLIRVYNKRRRIRLPKQDRVSHTKAMANCEDGTLDVYTWGPFLGDMGEQLMRAIRESPSCTIVAGGSAAGYLLDAFQQCVYVGRTTGSLTLLYTTGDAGVFEWALGIVLNVIHIGEKIRKPRNTEDGKKGTVQIVLALTDGGKSDCQYMDNVAEAEQRQFVERLRKEQLGQRMLFNSHLEAQSNSMMERAVVAEEHSSIELQVGRLDFRQMIKNDGTVFFQGSTSLHLAVKNACKGEKGVRLMAGPIYDGDVIRMHMALSSLGRRLCMRETNM